MNNQTTFALTGIVALLLTAGVIIFVVWYRNKTKTNNNIDLAILSAINSQMSAITNYGQEAIATGNRQMKDDSTSILGL